MKRVFVKPATPGLYVLDERNQRIPAEGREINKSVFISRLIKEGALIEGRANKETAETKGGKK